jgi:anti-sigma factor RsiW
MRHEDRHLTDEQLVRAADRELTTAEAAAVREHLASCTTCRKQRDLMAASFVDFAVAYRSAAHASPQPLAVSRAKLKARLSEAENSRWESAWSYLSGRNWVTACVAIVLAAFLMRIAYGRFGFRGAQLATVEAAGPLVPDAHLTPGAVMGVSASQVCSVTAPVEHRPPSSLQRAVFHEYGMDGAHSDGYEVDHLITPALGGSDDIQNLWPESYYSEWNAHVKDQLEDYLYNQVCSGKMDLPTAQREISTNWISAYQKYFHTERPLQHNSKLSPSHDRDSDG